VSVTKKFILEGVKAVHRSILSVKVSSEENSASDIRHLWRNQYFLQKCSLTFTRLYGVTLHRHWAKTKQKLSWNRQQGKSAVCFMMFSCLAYYSSLKKQAISSSKCRLTSTKIQAGIPWRQNSSQSRLRTYSPTKWDVSRYFCAVWTTVYYPTASHAV
jgi:hypothetical protein